MNATLVSVFLSAYQPSDGPPSTLGGDLSKRRLETTPRDRPLDFKESVELQVAEKRRELIKQLEELLKLTRGDERAGLLFRLGDLYAEESRSYPDDLDAQKMFGRMAVSTWSEIVQRYPAYDRTDEVLYALGRTLIDLDDGKRALIALRRLVEKFPKSQYVPNAWLAFGDWYFEHRQLDPAVEAYRKVHGPLATLAAYKLGWCLFNLSDFERAMEQFRTVALAPRLTGAPQGLTKEARTDFVRAFSRSTHPPSDAHELFNVLVTEPEDLRTMNKQLATLYYDAGRAKEAAVVFKKLIDERPDSPEAVGFQNHIVEVLLGTSQKQLVVQQLNRLAQLKGPDERSEALLSGIAVNWHNEAKKTRDTQTALLAAEAYTLYLKLFPSSPRANDLRFFFAELLHDELKAYERSAPHYAQVAKQQSRFQELAAYDAVLAYTEVASSIVPPRPVGIAGLALPPQKLAVLEACDAYLAAAPKGEHAAEVAFQAARLLYEWNHLGEAATRFHSSTLEHLATCVHAGNLSIDALNLRKDYAGMLAYTTEYVGSRCASQNPDFKADMEKLRAQLSFKLCTTPECFEAITTGELADEALINVAVLYEQLKKLDKAIAARVRFMRDLASSPLAPQNAWDLARLYEATADFEKAADVYERYPQTGPRARDAVFNEGVLRGELGQLQRAVNARQRFLKAWPSDVDAEKVMLSIAELHQKSGRLADAIAHLEAYARAYPAKAVEALGRIARIQEQQRDAAAARKTYARIAALYVPGRDAAPEPVARARLVALEPEFAKYTKLKLKWTRLANPGELRATLAAKTKALQELTRGYTGVVALKSADPAICALYKLGLAYEELADAIEQAPVPRDAPPAVVDALRDQLRPDGVRAKAEEAFSAAVLKSGELDSFNACSTAAREHLGGKMLEELPPMKLDEKPRATGLELLIDLQR